MPDVSIATALPSPELFAQARSLLDAGDPQLGVVLDHESGTSPTNAVAATAHVDGTFAGYSLLQRRVSGGDCSLDVVVTTGTSEAASNVIRALLENALSVANAPVVWWTRQPLTLFGLAVAAQLGGRAFRKIDRMDRTLFVADDDLAIETRPFTEADADDLLRINNEAFEGHPDRANMSLGDLKNWLLMLQEHPEDLLMIDGGFCWTKRQPNSRGELYVLGLDKAHQGKGLGKGLVYAGLSHIRRNHGATDAFLYVEHSNNHARKLYEKTRFKDANDPLTAFRFVS